MPQNKLTNKKQTKTYCMTAGLEN